MDQPGISKTPEEHPPLSSQKTNGKRIEDYVNSILKGMIDRRASDLHIRAGSPIIYRVDGHLVPVDKTPVSADSVKEILSHMVSDRQRKVFEAKSEVDFSYSVHGLGRFRGNSRYQPADPV